MTAPELVVLSRDKAEHYEPQGVEICISITDPKAPPARLSPRFAAVLRMEFSDVLSAGGSGDVLFAAEHARQILDFLARWPQAERVVIHCVAGASRSPGVALGICELRGWSTATLEQRYPFWNSWVRSLLTATEQPQQPEA
ncbi:MAG: hypothetical protein ABR499_01090 [Gemmatimonadaceae bacterium]